MLVDLYARIIHNVLVVCTVIVMDPILEQTKLDDFSRRRKFIFLRLASATVVDDSRPYRIRGQ